MAIFLTESSKVIVQGMTGSEGRRHTQRMLRSGTAVVGGVTPGKGGQSVDFDGATVPVRPTRITPARYRSTAVYQHRCSHGEGRG